MTSFKRRLVVLLSAALLSVSVMAMTFSETQVLANQGLASAQFYLGVMYYKGEGVPQDDTKAIEWYTKAANQGYAAAQYNLGYMYYYGQGVRQNSNIAKEWYGKACDNGQQLGCDSYKRLNTKGF